MTAVAGAAGTDLQIMALRARGFQFLNPRDEGGDVLEVIGLRVHGEVLDVVRLHGEHEATASRLPVDADILAPTTIFWQHTGTAHEVLDTMLALPDPAGGT